MATNIVAAALDAANEAALTGANLISLHTGDPGVDGTANELDTDGYARAAASFGASSGGVKAIDDVVTFEADGEDWPGVTHVGIWADGEGTTFLMSAPLASSRQINDGQTLTFSIGTIALTAAGAA